ncbi:ankyrin repeat domain-containing protein [Paraburkholderia bonniea]|uniref:ankyrin repeat domain-containing protein n=1 Tax=Paraburkholderia bonniea TaxID=2152891 RepID=UPI0025742F1E|nr:ankyrin repeat domain-containing protein [Paraburkholderia bonniea]WJF90988.1 ankyrin repeat domain-containing protein [Paraburkholderia bonniea]WJF94302.1 ankyrin repeat domain-containing protein [Paraburkholderia bonniea]
MPFVFPSGCIPAQQSTNSLNNFTPVNFDRAMRAGAHGREPLRAMLAEAAVVDADEPRAQQRNPEIDWAKLGQTLFADDLEAFKALLEPHYQVSRNAAGWIRVNDGCCFAWLVQIIPDGAALLQDVVCNEMFDEIALALAGACVEHGRTALLETLLQSGLEPDCQDYTGCTLLHLASELGQLASIELLLRYGAKVNALDHNGDTPLMVLTNSFVSMDVQEALRRLLTGGADSTVWLEKNREQRASPMVAAEFFVHALVIDDPVLKAYAQEHLGLYFCVETYTSFYRASEVAGQQRVLGNFIEQLKITANRSAVESLSFLLFDGRPPADGWDNVQFCAADLDAIARETRIFQTLCDMQDALATDSKTVSPLLPVPDGQPLPMLALLVTQLTAIWLSETQWLMLSASFAGAALEAAFALTGRKSADLPDGIDAQLRRLAHTLADQCARVDLTDAQCATREQRRAQLQRILARLEVGGERVSA